MSTSMRESRTYNSIINSLIGIITAVFNIILNFFVRIVIVRSLGEEINGIHSLFHNIASVMTLVETSMCTAMIIHLYELVKSKDIKQLNEIMSFYQKIYFMLSILFFVTSSILNLFLDVIVTTTIPMISVHIYFFIFSLAIVLNCVTYTYRLVLFADQKNRISAMATLIAEIVFRGLAALAAILLKSYFFFLICYIGEKLLGNLVCMFYVKKVYKGIRCTSRHDVDKDLKLKIMKTAKPLMLSKIADIVQNSSQGILISILLGSIAIVGYYGNYTLVTGAVGIMYSQLGAAFTSSFGNLATEGNREHMYNAYRKADIIMSSLAIIIFSGFVACIQDFVKLVFGESFLLTDTSMVIIAISMFITLINIPIISVQNATGTHKIDAHNMLIQALLSITLGYAGGKFGGIVGLLLGSLIPLFLFTTIIKGIKIYNAVFKKKLYKLFSNLLRFILVGMICGFFSFNLKLIIDFDSLILNILCKGSMTVFICILVLTVSMLKNKYFQEIIVMIRNKMTVKILN